MIVMTRIMCAVHGTSQRGSGFTELGSRNTGVSCLLLLLNKGKYSATSNKKNGPLRSNLSTKDNLQGHLSHSVNTYVLPKRGHPLINGCPLCVIK